MNLAELRTSFLQTLNRRDVTPSQVIAWLQFAIQRAQRLLDTPAAERIVDITWSAVDRVLPIPGDYLELRSILACHHELAKVNLSTALRAAGHCGKAQVFARDGNRFILGPRPSPGDVIHMTYKANAAELVVDTDTNWLSEIAPDVIVKGALREAFLHFQDVRADVYEAEFIKSIADLNNQASADELSNAVISPAYSFAFD